MRIILLLSFLLGLMIPVAFAQDSLQVTWSPNSSRECAVCHYEWAEPFVTGQKGTLIAPYPMDKEVSSERMCFSCHDGSIGDARLLLWAPGGENHKTGTPLKEGMNPPSTLPTVDNKVTCMTCHTAHGTGDPSSQTVQTSIFLRMTNEDSQLCKSCHNEMSGKFSHPLKEMTAQQMKEFTPGTVKLTADNRITCDSCHRPHGAPDNKLLRASGLGMELCRNCHKSLFPQGMRTDDLATAHIVSTEVDDVHIKEVIVRQKGQLGDNGQLVCFSCHNMHKAKGNALLIEENKESSFCRACHSEYDGILKSPHNMEKQVGFKTDQGKTAMDVGVCSTCHGSHRWQQKMPAVKTDIISSMCISCHNSKGVASKKLIDTSKFNHYVGDIAKDRQKILQDPEFSKLPDAAQSFLDKYFAKQRPRSMASKSMVSCATCHDIHADSKQFLREDASTGKLCLECHENQKAINNTSHGSSKLTGSCLGCHQVHNSNDSGLVKTSAGGDGCLSCHNDAATKTIQSSMKGLMPKELALHGLDHPVDIKTKTVFPAPMKPNLDGMIRCSSCHNPHAAQDNSTPMKRNFLRTSKNVTTMDQFCITCHEAQKGIEGTDHSVDPKVKSIVNPRTNRQAEGCDMCHKVHNAATKKFIFNVKGTYKTDSDYCIACHNPKGDAKEKQIDMMKGHIVGKLDKKPADVNTKYLTYENNVYRIECTNCHDPHMNGPKRGTEGTFATSFLKPLDNTKYNICMSCHTNESGIVGGGHDVAKFEKKNAQTRERTMSKDVCGSCHTLHNSDRNTYLMVGKTAEERCQNCHNKSDSAATKMAVNSHPTDVKVKDNNLKLPLEKDKVVCSTCHEAHRGTAALVRPQVAKVEDLCISCHTDEKWVAVSQHNMSLAKISDTKLQQSAKQNSCQPCHAAHNFDKDAKYMWARGNNKAGSQDVIYNSCVSCHASGGISKHVPEYLTHSKLFKMFPARKVWENYLYDMNGEKSKDGEMTCATCHDPHVWSKDPAKRMQAAVHVGKQPLEGDNTTSFLTGDVKDKFCAVCHDDVNARYDKYHDKEFRIKESSKRGILGRSSDK